MTLAWLAVLAFAAAAGEAPAGDVCKETLCLVQASTLGATDAESAAWKQAIRTAIHHDDRTCGAIGLLDSTCVNDDKCMLDAIQRSGAYGVVSARAIRVADQLRIELAIVDRGQPKVRRESRVVEIATFEKTPTLGPALDPTGRCPKPPPAVVAPPPVKPPPPVVTTPPPPKPAAVAPKSGGIPPGYWLAGAGGVLAAASFITMGVSIATLENKTTLEDQKAVAVVAGQTGLIVGIASAVAGLGGLIWALIPTDPPKATAKP